MSLGWWFSRRAVGAFARAEAGNVAMLWALMGAVLVGLVGLTVDFTRAQSIRAQLQNAADGAALVAERSSSLPLPERTAAARAFFDAEASSVEGDLQELDFEVYEMESGGHRVEVSVDMPLSLARLIRKEDWRLGVAAEAQAEASPPIEVALVLDNTGSMSNDMQTLRDAASDLTDYLFNLDGDSVRLALVPFVAQVNIGNQANRLAWTDQVGTAPYNGELLEDRSIGFRSTSNGKNNGNCNFSTLPFAGYSGPYRINWVKSGNRCYAFTPEGISHHQLFNMIPNVSWKGCVEARPVPYDVQDDAPTVGNPATMFVPFFWMDTADNYSNSYFADDIGDVSGITMSSTNGNSATQQQQREARFFNVFKYRNSNASNIDDTPPDTRGPNRGCPTPIVPLTQDEGTLQSAISQMRHWNGGGTNQVEGLSWGWRVLSPTAPFTEGEPYDDVRKVIVLMSDGENTNVGSDPVMGSDYAGMNHLGLWRDYQSGGLLDQLLGGILHGILSPAYRRNITSPNQYVSYVNDRERILCNNIKAAGIEIYTVIFRETDTATVNLMRNCASEDEPGKPKHFHRADSADQLHEAFQAIGSGIGQLRLTR